MKNERENKDCKHREEEGIKEVLKSLGKKTVLICTRPVMHSEQFKDF